MDAAKHSASQRKQQQMKRRLPLMCKAYNRREGCSFHLKCPELHLCFDFLMNRCSTVPCVKAHGLDTPRNIVVLQRMGWHGPNDLRLALDGLRRRVHGGQTVSVCLAYSLGCCRTADCDRLHVCYRHVLDICPLDHCALSHDVLNSQHNATLLAVAGLADTPVSELLRRLRDQLHRRPLQPAVCRAASSRPGGCQHHCLRPHYCEAFALGRCRYGDKCYKGHSLQDPHNRRVLRFCGWTERQVLEALSAINGQPVRLPANPETHADGGDREKNDKDDDRTPELGRRSETETGAGATARAKGSENGGSQGNRTERSSEKNVKHPKGHCQLSTQRMLQQKHENSDVVRRLETERQEWLEKEEAWQQKENEWQERQSKQMKEQAKRQKEWETQDRARLEREDQARAAREQEQQKRECENERLEKEMFEKEAKVKELLEKNTQLRDNYSSSEKIIITLNEMIAELEQQLASLQMLLQETETREQQKTLGLLRDHEQEQKRKLDELSKLQERISRQRECVECSICLGIFVEPRTLDCAHTFCAACIESVRRPDRATVPGGVMAAMNTPYRYGIHYPIRSQPIVCPICRRVANTEVPSLALKNIAELFPKVQDPEQPSGATALYVKRSHPHHLV